MNTAARIILFLFTSVLPWQTVYGQAAFPEPNWDRALAIETAESAATGNVLKSLYLSARAGESEQVLEALLAIEQNDDWPVPAREYTIWSFTTGLADMEMNSVSDLVLDYLSSYESRTLVAHDDRDSVGVPLFNISAAASGVRNSWARQQGGGKAEILLQHNPALWINAYLEASPVERRGFTDALDFASDEQLDALAWSAIEHLAEQPSLTAVAGKSALMLGDRELLQYTLALGSGPDLHHILKSISLNMDAQDSKELLFQAIRHGPDSKAGLAIAQLAPALLDDLEVRDKMFALLENPDLGASAALALGSSTNPEIHDRLNTLAESKDGPASIRASLAISTSLQSGDANR